MTETEGGQPAVCLCLSLPEPLGWTVDDSRVLFQTQLNSLKQYFVYH